MFWTGFTRAWSSAWKGTFFLFFFKSPDIRFKHVFICILCCFLVTTYSFYVLCFPPPRYILKLRSPIKAPLGPSSNLVLTSLPLKNWNKATNLLHCSFLPHLGGAVGHGESHWCARNALITHSLSALSLGSVLSASSGGHEELPPCLFHRFHSFCAGLRWFWSLCLVPCERNMREFC